MRVSPWSVRLSEATPAPRANEELLSEMGLNHFTLSLISSKKPWYESAHKHLDHLVF